MQIAPIFRPLCLGLDCGAHRTRLATPERGVVLDTPSVLAIETRTNQVLATGSEAEKMAGRVGTDIAIYWPVTQGEVADEALERALLQMFFREAAIRWWVISPEMMVTTAVTISPAARQSWVDVLSALGAGVPIADASGSFLVQLGYDRCEAVVVSLGSIVQAVTLPMGGNTLLKWLELELQTQLQFAVSRERLAHLLHHVVSLNPEVR